MFIEGAKVLSQPTVAGPDLLNAERWVTLKNWFMLTQAFLTHSTSR